MTWRRALLAAAVACLAGCGPKDRSAPGLYSFYCEGCHGPTGEGRGSARRLKRYPNLNLTASPLTARADRGAIRRRIAEGKGPMPAFARRLTPKEIESLVDFTLRLRKRERGD